MVFNKGILIKLCSGCDSAYTGLSKGVAQIQISIRGDGYARADGTNTYVEIKGFRLMAHELTHALRNHRVTEFTNNGGEIEAVRSTNMIMKQHFQRVGFPELSGVRNHYGSANSSLPKNAILKEIYPEIF